MKIPESAIEYIEAAINENLDESYPGSSRENPTRLREMRAIKNGIEKSNTHKVLLRALELMAPAPASEAEPAEATPSPPVNQYKPDIVSPPRETLQEMLDENPNKHLRKEGANDVYKVLLGESITQEIAKSLERTFEKPHAAFWIESQRLYDLTISDNAKATMKSRLQPIPVARIGGNVSKSG